MEQGFVGDPHKGTIKGLFLPKSIHESIGEKEREGDIV